MTDGQRPRREVITGPRRDVRRRTRRSAVEDIDQQTRVVELSVEIQDPAFKILFANIRKSFEGLIS